MNSVKAAGDECHFRVNAEYVKLIYQKQCWLTTHQKVLIQSGSVVFNTGMGEKLSKSQDAACLAVD